MISDKESMSNLLRCSPTNKNNIEAYQALLKANKNYATNIKEVMLSFLSGLPEMEIKNKASLFSQPSGNSKTKSYLITGDKVKIIQKSPDSLWINVGYINNKKMPLIRWVETKNVK